MSIAVQEPLRTIDENSEDETQPLVESEDDDVISILEQAKPNKPNAEKDLELDGSEPWILGL